MLVLYCNYTDLHNQLLVCVRHEIRKLQGLDLDLSYN